MTPASDAALGVLARGLEQSRLGHLRLKGRDPLVALGDGLLVVVAGAATVVDYFLGARRAFLLLLRLGFLTLRGFLAAILLTVHVPSCLSSRKAGRDEQCPHLYRYGHC